MQAHLFPKLHKNTIPPQLLFSLVTGEVLCNFLPCCTVRETQHSCLLSYLRNSVKVSVGWYTAPGRHWQFCCKWRIQRDVCATDKAAFLLEIWAIWGWQKHLQADMSLLESQPSKDGQLQRFGFKWDIRDEWPIYNMKAWLHGAFPLHTSIYQWAWLSGPYFASTRKDTPVTEKLMFLLLRESKLVWKCQTATGSSLGGSLFINIVQRVSITREVINNKLYLSCILLMLMEIWASVIGQPGVL